MCGLKLSIDAAGRPAPVHTDYIHLLWRKLDVAHGGTGAYGNRVHVQYSVLVLYLGAGVSD